jgi:hypothetical protein
VNPRPVNPKGEGTKHCRKPLDVQVYGRLSFVPSCVPHPCGWSLAGELLSLGPLPVGTVHLEKSAWYAVLFR